MRRHGCLLAFMAVGCGAGRRSPDGGPDAAIQPDGGSLDAAVDAGPTGCEDYVPDGNRACVPRGPFWFGAIVDEDACPNCDESHLDTVYQQAIDLDYLAHEETTDAYLIDLREVSNGEYAAYLRETGASPPPELCDNLSLPGELAGCPEIYVSGWTPEGEPPLQREGEPVTCVTPDEARGFCAWRGGRLPLSTEWVKAGRGAFPSKRDFPWADGIPATWDPAAFSEHMAEERLGGMAESSGDGACQSMANGGVARAEPVDSRPENASPYGLLHVLRNAAEWVEVAPTGDWFEENRIDVYGGTFGGFSIFDYFGPQGLSVVMGTGSQFEGMSGTEEGGYGPTSRERHLGFRCAYDL